MDVAMDADTCWTKAMVCSYIGVLLRAPHFYSPFCTTLAGGSALCWLQWGVNLRSVTLAR
jgi:hypothetical protein